MFPAAASHSNSSSSPNSAATAQLTAALSLQDQVTRAVASAEDDPVAYVVERLADSQGHRTELAIRSVLQNWGLPDSVVLEAFASLQRKNERGGTFKGDSAYLVGTLNRMGENRGSAA